MATEIRESARPRATSPSLEASSFGMVVIGRNEGERLRLCLRSALARGAPVLYVDSGSVDGSVPLARSMGIQVLELDPSRRFSAARARNEGFARMLELLPRLAYVQFVDGDCELIDGWLERGAAALDADRTLAATCGHVRERDPSASVYNRLCALEWRKDPGPVPACGGIFMVRAEAFRAVGGFRPEVIAAEDDELCLRLRRLGMGVELLDADMVVHDAAMKRFSQWWQRARRSGHAYAQGAALHGRGPERHMVRDRRRIWFWGLGLPLLALGAAWPTRGLSLALLGAYPLQVARIWRRERAQGWSHGDALLYAAFAVLGKVPGLLGLLEYHWRRWRGSAMTIIEHKQVGEPR